MFLQHQDWALAKRETVGQPVPSELGGRARRKMDSGEIDGLGLN